MKLKPAFLVCGFFITTLVQLESVTTGEEIEFQIRRVIDSRVVQEKEIWDPQKSAVIICDMWDAHHCLNAVRRVNEMAPRMNRLVKRLRKGGAVIIHAPSSCTGFYQNHPARRRALDLPLSQSIPQGINSWCDKIPAERDYPLDQSDGGEDDQPAEHAAWARELKSRGLNPRAPWKKQVATVEIADQDFITDEGEKVWSILEKHQIQNVLMVGVHTNMCVLGRPFGLRQLAKNGKNVVLVRDLTDTMYNPERWPFVDHYQGNRLIHRHIEKYVCGTVTSDQILGGSPFRFKNDRPKNCLILCAESLYETEKTLKEFGETLIRDQLGFNVHLLTAGKGANEFDQSLMKKIQAADLLVLSIRRRALPGKQLAAIKSYLKSEKPLIALRTSSHAFDTRGKHPDGHSEWREFDSEVLGCNYEGHHANGLDCKLEWTSTNSIMTGVDIRVTQGSLYRSSPLKETCTPLLYGKVPNADPEPVAWTHRYGKSRVFYTSLGHPADFQQAGFRRLLENGIRWASEMKIGSEPQKKK